MSQSPFSTSLLERWRSTLICSTIYPAFPFKKESWKALAFNRDTAGNVRIPVGTWRSFLSVLETHTNDNSAFIASPTPILAGIVSDQKQPFVVPLTYDGVVAHFTQMSVYLPEFVMVGGSEKWAIWGDSDMTLLGAEESMIRPLVDGLGGDGNAIAAMAHDFGLGPGPHDEGMWRYLERLVKGQST